MKKDEMGIGPTWIPLNFETDQDHFLDTKTISDFSHLIIIITYIAGGQ